MLPKNLLCFSPIRWDFTMYRPQQLLVRFAEYTNVYFFEDPIFDADDKPFLTYSTRSETLWKLVPHLVPCATPENVVRSLTLLLDQFLEKANMDKWAFWFYTDRPLVFTEKYKPKVVIYDQIPEEDGKSDWNSVFSSVREQIKNHIATSGVIELAP